MKSNPWSLAFHGQSAAPFVAETFDDDSAVKGRTAAPQPLYLAPCCEAAEFSDNSSGGICSIRFISTCKRPILVAGIDRELSG